MSEHVRPFLSDLLDGRLAAARLASVEKHLDGCADCRGELQALRDVSAKIKTLPQSPLPSGFMDRLSQRRAMYERIEKPKKSTYDVFSGLLPGRVLVFAASSVVCLILLAGQARLMFGPSVSILNNEEAPLPSRALTSADFDQARTAKPAALAQAPVRALASARGEPVDAAPAAPKSSGPSNEELHADLEKQKKKMGIRAVAAKSMDDPWIQARKDLTLAAGGGPPPAAEIAGREKPADLKGPLENPSSKPLPTEDKGAPVAAAPEVPVAPPAASLADGKADGVVLDSEEARLKLWAERGMRLNPPSVKYAQSRLVVVMAPDLGSALEIIGVETLKDKVSVRYRMFVRVDAAQGPGDKPANPVKAYQFRVIPKTDKPITFDRVAD